MKLSLCTDPQASAAHSRTRILWYNPPRMIVARASRPSLAILVCILINHLLIVVQAQNHCKGGALFGNLSPRQVKIAKDIEIAFCRGRNLLGRSPVSQKKMYDFIYNQLKYRESKECMKNRVTTDIVNKCMYLLYNVVEIWQCFRVALC